MLNLKDTVIYALFRIVSAVVALLQIISWWLLGIRSKLNKIRTGDLYEESIHILNIVGRAKWIRIAETSRNDFFAVHHSFAHPKYILQENVSLYTFTKTSAVFVETSSNIDIYNTRVNPFLYLAQFDHAYKLIIMPLSSYNRLATDVGDPKFPVMILSNPGRCGSTLFSQIMESIPGTITIAEPDAMTKLVFLRLENAFTDEQADLLVANAVRILCRQRFQTPKLCCIKLRSHSVQQVQAIATHIPSIHHLFLYRDSLKCVQSMDRAFYALGLMPVVKHVVAKIPHLSALLPQYLKFESASMFLSSLEGGFHWLLEDGFMQRASPLAYWCVNWALTIKEYLHIREAGVNIAAIRYEDILRDPVGSWEAIIDFCNFPPSELRLKGDASDILAKDSQVGTGLDRTSLKDRKAKLLSAEDKVVTDMICDRFDIDRLGETTLLPGTITHMR